MLNVPIHMQKVGKEHDGQRGAGHFIILENIYAFSKYIHKTWLLIFEKKRKLF